MFFWQLAVEMCIRILLAGAHLQDTVLRKVSTTVSTPSATITSYLKSWWKLKELIWSLTLIHVRNLKNWLHRFEPDLFRTCSKQFLPADSLAVCRLHFWEHEIPNNLRHVHEFARRSEPGASGTAASSNSRGTGEQALELHRALLQAEEAGLRWRQFSAR